MLAFKPREPYASGMNAVKQNAGEVAVVIVAAGRGERAGQSAEGPKQYRLIGGEPVMRRTVAAFADHPCIGRIVIAIHRDDGELFKAAVGSYGSRVEAVTGGATRQESTLFALRALTDEPPGAVLIHDCVRPFLDSELISRVSETALGGTGALPALPVSDTLKRSGAEGLVEATVSRDGLHAAQTPQGFPYHPILDAHEKANSAGRLDFTDDAAIAEWAGIPVRLVAGSPDNVKLTWAKDLDMADERLSRQGVFPDVRTGNGYDVHAFGPGDAVRLCGVEVPHDWALSGHSDADVGLHALTDALLATCGAGDIGTHFPPSDPQWKGAASRIFVEHAVKTVRDKGGRIANADITLICEAPRVGPHREAMVAAMADMLGIAAERISVKATTNEKLGFVGREEGIAAIATATVVYPGSLPDG
ncbi:MAG: bifunctional 2-C-methyl-D-erythritol 4-phosphate cytidylyltransferase/2-C-methyl-D-erythritol 2,4-cyclodiphosphate synthase [Rhizobiaceae bacterium]|nr:bifunctional 2-C-methyl-D-erythritol 4-phosphate cytidylyltransferase/2-C-methyl-D-erythritol 2,4-cyclodiphosphate synthase [Rhizobiaceae bacterium]